MGYLRFRKYSEVAFNYIMVYQNLWNTAQREIYKTNTENVCSSKVNSYESENTRHRMGDNIVKHLSDKNLYLEYINN